MNPISENQPHVLVYDLSRYNILLKYEFTNLLLDLNVINVKEGLKLVANWTNLRLAS